MSKDIKILEEDKREAWGIIKSLSAKLEQRQDIHGGLIADKDALQERLQDARKEGRDIQAKLDAKTDELIKQVASGNHAHIILSDTIDLQRDEITGLRTMRSGLEANIGDLEQRLEKKSTEVNGLSKELESSHHEIFKLAGRVTELESAVSEKEKESDRLRQHISTLRQQLDQKSAEVDELTESMESQNVDLDILGDEVQERNDKVSDLESVRTKQQELIAELESTIKLYHNSNEEIAGIVRTEATKNVALIKEAKEKDKEISQIKRLNGLLLAKLNERGRADAGPSQS